MAASLEVPFRVVYLAVTPQLPGRNVRAFRLNPSDSHLPLPYPTMAPEGEMMVALLLLLLSSKTND